MDLADEIKRDSLPIFDELDALIDRDWRAWDSAWEDWARRASEMADRCEAAGFPGGADDMRWMIREMRRCC